MFLTYLDDAGSAKNPDEEYLVLGGVCVSEHQVNDLTHALEALAAKYDAAAPDTVEFHASAIYTGKIKPWDGLKEQVQRREVLKEVLGIFRGATLPACALACAVHKKSFPARDPIEMAFEELCRWFDGFLKERHQQSGVDEKGMIFLDESTYETTLRQIARNFRRMGLTTSDGRYIVDGPHFVKSHNTRCVQFADHVAYSVFRYFHAQDNNYLNVVLNRFQSDGRVMSGLIHLEASKDDCTCPACLTVRACAGKLVKV
jgi:hypothetical protein